MAAPELARRALPQQARSQATLERLFQVSAELLEEVGVHGFNTNLLAERAGVGVRAIYRYFPNKWALLVAMAERASALERRWIGDLEGRSEPDWRAALAGAIDGYYAAARAHPGYAALRAASQASAELRAVDDRTNRDLQNELALALRAMGVTIADAHLSAVCLTLIETSNRMLDIALQSPPPLAELLVMELKRMLIALLEPYAPH